MSQSKTSYGAKQRKSTARSRRARHTNKSETTANKTVEPACPSRSVGHSIEKRDWVEKSYTERFREFYQPCEWPECFADGHPDVGDIEKVVRSTHHPTTYHRPRNDEPTCEHETTAPETDTGHTRILQPIKTITDLEEGQRVVWENRKQPLCVVEATTKPDGTVSLRGPGGGEYQVEGRPEYPQPYYLPKTGYLSEIIRVRVETRAEKV